MYRCPTCWAPLKVEPRRYTCPSGHGFDRGRTGYVNLLTGRRRKFGDSDEMIRARRAALDSGAYLPLREFLAGLGLVGDALDVGCGEGYFTRAILQGEGWSGAVDSSTLAARLAAGRDKGTEYAVADAFNLPVGDKSVDVIWSVLGPVVPTEFERVIRPNGAVVTVSPGPNHLWEIKRILLENPKRHDEQGPSGLRQMSGVRRSERVSFTMELDPPLATSLFEMTPYGRVARNRSVTNPITVTADFIVTIMRISP